MPTTAPIFDEAAHSGEPHPGTPEAKGISSERFQQLEGDVAELRHTIARFAEMMIGEVKDLRQSHAEIPDELADSTAEPTNGMASAAPETVPAGEYTSRRPWLLMEFLQDVGTTIRMYLDPRYRVRRSTQMLVPLILGLLVLNYLFFGRMFPVPILREILEKMADIVLAILLYKVISREIVRYRQILVQLAAWQGYRHKRSTFIINSEPPTTRLEID